LLIDQFLLGRHAQHLRSERCCNDRLNSPIPERHSGTCSSESNLRLDWRSFAANTATSTEVPFDRSRQIQRVARRLAALVPSNWRLCAFGPGGQRRLSRRLRCCEALRCPAKTVSANMDVKIATRTAKPRPTPNDAELTMRPKGSSMGGDVCAAEATKGVSTTP